MIRVDGYTHKCGFKSHISANAYISILSLIAIHSTTITRSEAITSLPPCQFTCPSTLTITPVGSVATAARAVYSSPRSDTSRPQNQQKVVGSGTSAPPLRYRRHLAVAGSTCHDALACIGSRRCGKLAGGGGVSGCSYARSGTGLAYCGWR